MEYGDAGSQYARGVEYEIGSGVPVDKAKALHWFELAAAQGDKYSQAKVNYYYEENRKAEQQSEEIRQKSRESAAREAEGSSVWDRNAASTAKALRDAQSYDNARRNADYRRDNNCSGANCNNR